MKFIDLTGQRFGKLLVLGIDPEQKYNSSGRIQWKCQCDCGTICYKSSEVLKKPVKTGIKACSTRCGALIPNGTRFAKLTVIEPIIDEKGHTQYKCLCDCGKITITTASRLKDGTTKSCGCFRKDRMSNIGKSTIQDISNQRFGKLTAIRPTEKRQTKSVVWECKCDCGNIHLASIHNLKAGNVTGCPDCRIKSKGEEKIKSILTKNKIPFISEKTFDNCRNPRTNKLLRFDFFIENKYLVEFDGKQHFTPTNSFPNANYEELKERDKYKNQWCKENNIPLIRIPYTELEFLNINDLLLQTTKFLI